MGTLPTVPAASGPPARGSGIDYAGLSNLLGTYGEDVGGSVADTTAARTGAVGPSAAAAGAVQLDSGINFVGLALGAAVGFFGARAMDQSPAAGAAAGALVGGLLL